MTDHGSVSVVIGALGALLVLVALAVAALGMGMAASERAATAAEAAALAAATATFPPLATATPVEEARRLAAANGARLISCRCDADGSYRPRTAVVTVEIETNVPVLGTVGFRRTAAAELEPVDLLR